MLFLFGFILWFIYTIICYFFVIGFWRLLKYKIVDDHFWHLVITVTLMFISVVGIFPYAIKILWPLGIVIFAGYLGMPFGVRYAQDSSC